MDAGIYKFRIWVLLSVLSFMGAGYVQAQTRQVKKADTAYKYHMYNEAVTQYQKGFAKMSRKANADPDEKNRILFQIAESYRCSGQLKQAARQYQRCIRAGYYKAEPGVYF
ncbi:MAG: hypothetical protein K2I83_00430, partial [Bacteroidales bacterium]|nr:hypothetical protein [Bacteroidales bacterium]